VESTWWTCCKTNTKEWSMPAKRSWRQ